MSNLANLESTIKNAKKVLGKPESFAWEVFNKIDGKKTSPIIAKIINKKPTNVSKMLLHLYSMGLLVENGKKGKAVIYKKISELKSLKSNTRVDFASSMGSAIMPKDRDESEIPKRLGIKNVVIDQVVEIGKKLGIENIDQNWIDALVILNFIETASTKFLMDHGFSEEQVKKMKWEQKFSQVENQLQIEAKARGHTIRTSSISFFKNYRTVRNEQDHHAHLPSAKTTKEDVGLLRKNLQIFVQIAFIEPSKHA